MGWRSRERAGSRVSNALNKATAEPGRLPVRTKLVYAWGDHTVNLSLSALSLLYFVFLANVVGLRPALAGAVPLIGRAVDAFTDPLMGRLSDLTRFRAGRRRPYFLIGALPFGASFALLWSAAPMGSQGALFAYYGLTYVLYSVSVTVLSVPYLALLPEMALDYDERTSLNTYRSAAAILGTLAAVSLRPLAEAFGGGREGFASAGAVAAVWLTLPWLFVYAVSFERKDFQRPVQIPFREAALAVARHGTYRRLCALFLCARIAVDLIGAMFLPFFIFWLGRPGDFDIALPSLLISFCSCNRTGRAGPSSSSRR
jgi:Na+/melibiose symporter-like transporter